MPSEKKEELAKCKKQLDRHLKESGRTYMEAMESKDMDRSIKEWVAVFGVNSLINTGLDDEEELGLTTPLMNAAHDGNAAAVSLLLSLGADTARRSSHDNITALHFALRYQHKEVVNLLFARKLEFSAKDSEKDALPCSIAEASENAQYKDWFEQCLLDRSGEKEKNDEALITSSQQEVQAPTQLVSDEQGQNAKEEEKNDESLVTSPQQEVQAPTRLVSDGQGQNAKEEEKNDESLVASQQQEIQELTRLVSDLVAQNEKMVGMMQEMQSIITDLKKKAENQTPSEKVKSTLFFGN